MKILLCLCALFFAGQTMAQTTCSNATFNGRYAAEGKGTFLNAAAFSAAASFLANGDGTGTLDVNYSIAGVPGQETEAINYTVNASCKLTANASLAGVPLTVAGYLTTDGSYLGAVATTVGVNLSAVAHRSP